MEPILYSTLAFLASICIIVVIHEWGHFIVARLCGVQVLAFSVGFGSVLLRHTAKNGTEWRISALPLGGYCKFLDTHDKDSFPEGSDPAKAFDRKPLPTRIAIVAAGPLMNLLVAVLIYWGFAVQGSLQVAPVIGTPAAGTAASAAGLQRSDRVCAVDGTTVRGWGDLYWNASRAAGRTSSWTIVRGEAERTVTLNFTPLTLDPSGEQDFLLQAGIAPDRRGALVVDVTPGSPADKARFAPGDVIVAVEGKPVATSLAMVQAFRSTTADEVHLTVKTPAGKTVELAIRPDILREGAARIPRIGVHVRDSVETVLVREGPLEAAGTAFARVWQTVDLTVRTVGKVLVGRASVKNFSGPVAIADYAGKSARMGWKSFLSFMALISISVGALNLLPIPVLDGGHLLYYSVELLIRRPVPESWVRNGQKFGMALLLALTVVVFANDLARFLG